MLSQRFVPAPLTSKHVVRFSAYGATQQFGVYVRHSSGPLDAGALAAAANIIDTWVSDAATRALIPTVASATDIVSTDESSQNGARLVTTTGVAGTRASAPVAPGVAAVVSLHTAQRGRAFRGRIFWPYPCVNQLASAGILNQADADAIAGQFEVLRLSLVAGGTLAQAVVSRYQGYIQDDKGNGRIVTRAKAREGNATVTNVNAVTCGVQLRSQRKRNVGIGV